MPMRSPTERVAVTRASSRAGSRGSATGIDPHPTESSSNVMTKEKEARRFLCHSTHSLRAIETERLAQACMHQGGRKYKRLPASQSCPVLYCFDPAAKRSAALGSKARGAAGALLWSFCIAIVDVQAQRPNGCTARAIHKLRRSVSSCFLNSCATSVAGQRQSHPCAALHVAQARPPDSVAGARAGLS